jgi:hypothetical protein
VNDLEYLDAQTKISWSCSGTIAGGVVKKRDFVTRSHYCAMQDGTLVIANRAEEHEDAPSSDEYIREAPEPRQLCCSVVFKNSGPFLILCLPSHCASKY